MMWRGEKMELKKEDGWGDTKVFGSWSMTAGGCGEMLREL